MSVTNWLTDDLVEYAEYAEYAEYVEYAEFAKCAKCKPVKALVLLAMVLWWLWKICRRRIGWGNVDKVKGPYEKCHDYKIEQNIF